MKWICISFFFIFSLTNQYGQGFKPEEYFRDQRERIIFNPDSTFLYSNYYSRKLAYGKWEFSDDTIFLKQLIVFDTLYYNDTIGYLLDQPVVKHGKIQVLSYDIIPEYFYRYINTPSEQLAALSVAELKMKKLYYKKDRLYEFDESGKIRRKKDYFQRKQ